MKRSRLPVACSILLLLTVTDSAFPTVRHLKIIHWNDFHSQIEPITSAKTTRGGLLNFKRIVDSLRAVAAEYGDACLALDAGDEFQGSLISTITKGRASYRLLNLMKPDAVALGNHEFDYGWPNLRTLLRSTVHFPVTNANITDETGSPIAKRYIIKRVHGLQVAIIGLTLQSLASSTLPESILGLHIEQYDSVLPDILREVKQRSPDLIILLTHIGVVADSALAARYPEVNVIVGGHSHTPLQHPMRVGRTVIVQAGSKGRWVGELDLDVDTDGNSVVSSSGKLIDVRPGDNTDATAARAVKTLLNLVDSSYSEQIGTLVHDWYNRYEYNNNLSCFEASVFREALGSDLGCINHGGIRKSLPKGPILLKDIYEINPFQNKLIRITIRGDRLREALEHMLSADASETCDFSGLRCVFDRTKHAITAIMIGEKEVKETAQYTIVTNAFVASKLNAIFGLHPTDVSIEPLGSTDADIIAAEIRRRHNIDGTVVPWLTQRN